MATQVSSGQEEIHRTFQLAPGARVEVRGVNGSVDIETADTDTAEVHVVRMADDKSDLERQKIIIEHTPESLIVRADNSDASWWGNILSSGSTVRQRITLKIPRESEVKARGINGPVKVGEVKGSVEVAGINGRVEVAQAGGDSEINGINGGVTIGVSQLGADGMNVSGINGAVEFRLHRELNADVSVNGLHGGLSIAAPGMIVQEQLKHSNMRARIGAGGAPISINGINGRLSFQTLAAN